MVSGYACKDHEDIMINSVSSTKRAAMVNALVIGAGIPVLAVQSDELIVRLFIEHCAKKYGWEIVLVDVKEV